MRIPLFFFWCLAVPALLFPCAADADIIPEGRKPVHVCATIDNLDEYPDIALVAVVFAMGQEEKSRYIVEPGKCLYKGYKFNRLEIYAVSRADLAALGIENVEPGTDPLVLEVEHVPTIRDRYVDEDSDLTEILESWRIAGFSETHTILYNSSETRKYSGDSSSDFHQDYDPPETGGLRETLAP